MHRVVRLFVTAAALLAVSPAAAHFVWLEVLRNEQGRPATAALYFGEEAAPGSAALVDRMDPAVAWVQLDGKTTQPLELEASLDEESDEGALIANLPEGADACSVEAACQYGVFSRGTIDMLLNYYAKALVGSKLEDLTGLESSGKLPLDILLKESDGQLQALVLWNGEPVADASVTVTTPSESELRLKTNSDGLVDLPWTEDGKHSLLAQHVEADKAGEFDGKKYSQTWHFCTATCMLPAPMKSADAEGAPQAAPRPADDTLANAREQRAVWEGFQGFESKLAIHQDGVEEHGTVIIDEEGGVTLEGFETLGKGFVKQQIESMIMHRMPTTPFDNEAVFEEEEGGDHVLGPLVRLANESMGSVYRIKDGVITEVNRNMGPLRFTISVMDVERNEAGKYMPHAYNVSFWTAKGDLDSSMSYLNEWVKVGPYELPDRAVIVVAKANTREVTEMVFTEHKLTEKQVAQSAK